MPATEENKELRDLVAESLKAKGVLGKVQAEIRASVFLALEEQDVFKDKSPFLNQPLKDFLRTPDGLMALSLVREFLEFFNLEFSAMVFDPETHAGIDYTYEGRSKLAQDLSLDSSSNLPLLAHVVGSPKPTCAGSPRADPNLGTYNGAKPPADLIALSPEHLSNGVNGDSSHVRPEKTEMERRNNNFSDDYAKSANRTETSKDKIKSKDTSLTSLSNLPPLNNKNMTLSSQKGNDLKALIDMGLNSKFDTPSEREKQPKSGSKETSDSDSEIEEEIASNNSNLSAVTAVSVNEFLDRTNSYVPPYSGSVKTASVNEEFEKLDALNLSFVKDLPLNLLGCRSSQSSDKISTNSLTDLDSISESEPISEIHNFGDGISTTHATSPNSILKTASYHTKTTPHLANMSILKR